MKVFHRLGVVVLVMVCLSVGCRDKDRNRAIALMNDGIAQAERGNYNGAIRRLEESVRVDPDYGHPYYYLGMIRLKEFHAPEAAVPDLRRAADLMPEHAPTFHLLGTAHMDLGDRREAEQALTEAVRLNPNHARAWLRLGELQEQNGQVMEAIDSYTRAIYADPRLPYGYNHLGNIYALYEHPEEAIAVLEEGLRNAGDPTNANDLGTVYLRTGRYGAAVEAFERAVQMDPTSITYNYNLGLAHAQMFTESQSESDRMDAREHLELAAARCATLGSQARCNAIRTMLDDLEQQNEQQ